MSNLSHTVLTGTGTVKNGTKGGAFSSDFSNDFDTGTVDPAVRQAALRLVGAAELRRDALFEEVLLYAKATDEWRRTLTDDETARWEGRLQGYADAVNLAAPCPFTDATPAEIAAGIARGCGKFSYLSSQQRLRAYRRAARVRSRNAERNEAILSDHAVGVSERKLAARYKLSRGGIRAIVATAKSPLVDNSIPTAKSPPHGTPIATAKSPPWRPVCRPRNPEAIPPDEVVCRSPLEGAQAHGPAVSKRENEAALTDKAGWVREGGNPSLAATAPASATSHPGRPRPPETEAASGGAPRRGPEVGQRLDEMLRSLVDSKRSVHEVPPDAKHITDPTKIAEREERRRQWSTQAAALTGLQAGPEVGEGSRE